MDIVYTFLSKDFVSKGSNSNPLRDPFALYDFWGHSMKLIFINNILVPCMTQQL